LFRRLLPMGDVVEIKPAFTLASSLVTRR
jgi:hypothetical protein